MALLHAEQKATMRLNPSSVKYSTLLNTIHVIDVPKVTEGMVLSIVMNGELDKAVGYLKSLI